MGLVTRNTFTSILLFLIVASFAIVLASDGEPQLETTTNAPTPLAEDRMDYEDELEDIVDPDSPADPSDVAEVVQLFESLQAKIQEEEGDEMEAESGRAIHSSYNANKLKVKGSYAQLEKLLSQAGVDVSALAKMPPNPLGLPPSPTSPQAAALGGPPFAPMAGLLTAGLSKMGQQDVEDIKAELRNMLFGDEEPLPTAQKRVQHAQERQRNERRPNRERDRQRSPSVLLQPPSPARNSPSVLVSTIREGRPGLGGNRDGRPQDPLTGNSPHPRAPVKEFRPPPPNPFQLPTDNGFVLLDSQLSNSNVRPVGRPPQQFSTADGLLRPPPFAAALPGGGFRPSDSLQRPEPDTFRPLAPPQAQPQRNSPQLPPRAPFRSNSPPSGQNIRPPHKPTTGNAPQSPNFAASNNGVATRRPSQFGSAAVGDCPQYTDGLCLDVRTYPSEAILNMLHRNKPMVDAMLAEVRTQSADDLVEGVSSAQERQYNRAHYFGNRRQDDGDNEQRDFASEGGFLCPSEVTYGRPKRALNSKGVWKYIINMGEYTQTLRLEKCLSPGNSCSYVSPHYQSQCSQVYNYHRLLSWDEQRGLHVDIYKIPTCCSCHIEGYAHSYPPFDKDQGTSATQRLDSKQSVTAAKAKPTAPPASVSQRSKPDPKLPQLDNIQSFTPSFANGFDTDKIEAFFTEQFADFPTFVQPIHTKRRSDNSTELFFDDSREANREKYRERTKINRKESSSSKAKVNYDYHPIIDFFHPYVANEHNSKSSEASQ